MKHQWSFGDHNVYQYDQEKFNFRQFFEDLYGCADLEGLGDRTDLTVEGISDVETDLHKKFYADIKTRPAFKELYCRFIREIHEQFFPDEEYLIYQSFPSVRFQFKNNVAIPPHYDSDHIGCHPLGEKNFILPITDMYGTKRVFIEGTHGSGDFRGIDLKMGELFYFNGNRCTHYNQKNVEDSIRISLDFRVLRVSDYKKYITSGQITTTNPRDPAKVRVPTKMVIGGYYQLTRREECLADMVRWTHQKDMLLQTRPNFGAEEKDAVTTYMSDFNNFFTEFRQTEAFERELATVVGSKHCVAVTSGNVALIVALMALGVGPGDEVIVPNYTMIASANSVRACGAKVVLCDVEMPSLTLTCQSIEDLITPRTKAVMHVSLNNRQSGLEGLVEWLHERGIAVVEDAAQSLGAFAGGRALGTFGDVGCFSLSTPKIISTGQGGFLVTDSDEIAKKARMIKNFGRRSGGVDVFEVFGQNYKFTDIQAVIGREQLKKLPGRILFMRELYDWYKEGLVECDGVSLGADGGEGWIPWFVDVFLERRDALAEWLKVHGIQTRPCYPPICNTPMYAEAGHSGEFAVSHYVSDHGLFLPSHTLVTKEQVEFVCKLIKLWSNGA
jgi:perosamine synthetase